MPVNGNFHDLQVLYAANLNSAFAQAPSLSGDTFTGPLHVDRDPSDNMQVATKQYVDVGDQNVEILAQAAFDAANSASGGGSGGASNAYVLSAFTAANTAQNTATAAFTQANTANTNAASATTIALAAFNQANATGGGGATNAFVLSAFSAANNAQNTATYANTLANNAFTTANNNSYGIYNLNSSTLRHYRAAVAKILSGTGRANVIIIGDSTTAGAGAGNNSANLNYGNAFSNTYTRFLASMLSKIIPVSDNSFLDDQNVVGQGIAYPTYDPRVTMGTGWTNGPLSLAGLLFKYVQGGGAGKLSFTPKGQFDTFKIHYLQQPSNGTLNVNIDGVTTLGNIVAGNATSALMTTTFTTTKGNHTINLMPVDNGNVWIQGITAYDSTTPAIDIIQLGFHGATVSGFTSTGAIYSPQPSITALNPDLTIINLTINDSNSNTPLANYQANLQSIVNTASSNGDVILMIGAPSNTTVAINGTLQNYVNVVKSVAFANNCGLIDLSQIWGSYAITNPLMPYYDNLHPAYLGHKDIASIIYNALNKATSYSFDSITPASRGGIGAISITQAPYNCSASSPDNIVGLQSAVNDAIAAGVPLFIPSLPSGSSYKYTAPLVINGNLTIYGNSITQNWAGGINVPLGTPPLAGSLLGPTSNGADAIDIIGTSTQVNMHDIGILFQTPFIGTGDGINYTPAQDVQGLSGSRWDNVYVYGHDGNHYAYNLTNPLLNTFCEIYSYGGGVVKMYGNASTTNFYGNNVFLHPYGQVVVGGTANGFDLEANGPQRINLNLFLRPQAIIDKIPGIYPVGNPPTSAQYIWYQDDNVYTTTVIAPDIETNCGASMRLGAQGQNNNFDWSGIGTDAANVFVSAWGTNGIMFGPRTKTFTDITSNGAGINTGIFSFPGTHINASNSTTYPVLSTVYVAPPISGNNVTATRLSAIYATGEIFTTSDLGSLGGAFISGGTVNLNQNSNFPTNIGTGSTTSNVSIGGGNNLVTIGKQTAIGTSQNVGFPVLPTMVGAPTGIVPAGAVVVDSVNQTLWVSLGGGNWQTGASNTYVLSAFTQANTANSLAANALPLAGGTLTGPVTMFSAPLIGGGLGYGNFENITYSPTGSSSNVVFANFRQLTYNGSGAITSTGHVGGGIDWLVLSGTANTPLAIGTESKVDLNGGIATIVDVHDADLTTVNPGFQGNQINLYNAAMNNIGANLTTGLAGLNVSLGNVTANTIIPLLTGVTMAPPTGTGTQGKITSLVGLYWPAWSGSSINNNITLKYAALIQDNAAIIQTSGKIIGASGQEIAPTTAAGVVSGRIYYGSYPMGVQTPQSMAAGLAVFAPLYIPTRTTFTKIGARVTTGNTGGSIQFAIYKPVNGVPTGAPIYFSSANVIANVSNTDVVASGQSIPLEAGSYMVAVTPNAGGISLMFQEDAGATRFFGSANAITMDTTVYTSVTYGNPTAWPSSPPLTYSTIYGTNFVPLVWVGN